MSKPASVDTYVRPESELGTAHFNFKVAHRGGELCPICGSTIEPLLVQNRGTYFCPAASFRLQSSDIEAGSGWI